MATKQVGRKPYSPGEAYGIVQRGLRMMPTFRQAMSTGVLSPEFKERIMLAVTEVNGCALCSYAHTQMALESGMDAGEISAMLAGETGGAPDEELPAILFAQHYADSRGKPSTEAWERLVEVYGQQKALAILGAIRIIMVGNTYGMPFGSFKSRLSGHADEADPRSSLGYELIMMLSLVPFVPAAFIHTLVANALKQPLIGS